MADKTINDGRNLSFGLGGYIIVSDGTDDFTLKNIVPGSVSVQEGGRELIHDYDNGDLKAPRAGLKLPSEIAFALARTEDLHGTDTVFDTFKQVVTADVISEFTVTVRFPDNQGATDGTELVLTQCAIVPEGRSVSPSGGSDADTIQLSFRSRQHAATVRAYSDV